MFSLKSDIKLAHSTSPPAQTQKDAHSPFVSHQSYLQTNMRLPDDVRLWGDR
jgi:hypothetical protein